MTPKNKHWGVKIRKESSWKVMIAVRAIVPTVDRTTAVVYRRTITNLNGSSFYGHVESRGSSQLSRHRI